MTIQREGRIVDQLLGRSEPRWRPAQDGLYSVSFLLRVPEKRADLAEMVDPLFIPRTVEIQLNDVTAEEMKLLSERYRNGKPLKITIE